MRNTAGGSLAVEQTITVAMPRSWSPDIADQKFCLLDGTFTALDLADGAVSEQRSGESEKLAALVRLAFARHSRGTEFWFVPGGTVVMRAADGHISGRTPAISTPPPSIKMARSGSGRRGHLQVPLTVSEGAAVSVRSKPAMRLPTELAGIELYQGTCGSLPLIHDGLVYAITGHGILMVFDATSLALVLPPGVADGHLPGRASGSVLRRGADLAGCYIYLRPDRRDHRDQPGRNIRKSRAHRHPVLYPRRAAGKLSVFWGTDKKYCRVPRQLYDAPLRFFDGTASTSAEENLMLEEPRGRRWTRPSRPWNGPAEDRRRQKRETEMHRLRFPACELTAWSQALYGQAYSNVRGGNAPYHWIESGSPEEEMKRSSGLGQTHWVRWPRTGGANSASRHREAARWIGTGPVTNVGEGKMAVHFHRRSNEVMETERLVA